MLPLRMVTKCTGAVGGCRYIGMLVMYLAVAITGYAVFGDLTDSPILSNLPRVGTVGSVVTVVKLLTVSERRGKQA